MNKYRLQHPLEIKKVLIFDFDGVIVDSNKLKSKAFKILYKKHKTHIGQILYFHEKFTSLNRYKKIRYINKHIIKQHYDIKDINEYISKFNKISFSLLIKSSYLPGLVKLLRNNYSKREIVINSAAPKFEISLFLENKIINKYVSYVYGAPNSKLKNFRKIFRKYSDFKLKHFIYFGDSISDYEFSKKVNIDFIGLNFDKMNKLNKFKNEIKILKNFNNFKIN